MSSKVSAQIIREWSMYSIAMFSTQLFAKPIELNPITKRVATRPLFSLYPLLWMERKQQLANVVQNAKIPFDDPLCESMISLDVIRFDYVSSLWSNEYIHWSLSLFVLPKTKTFEMTFSLVIIRANVALYVVLVIIYWTCLCRWSKAMSWNKGVKTIQLNWTEMNQCECCRK